MRFTKEQLIATLEEMRPKVEAHDVEVRAKHLAEELQYLEKWRARLQEALSWDYATAKKHHFDLRGSFSGPTCPQSLVGQLEYWLTNVKRSEQKRYAISPSGHYSQLHKLLMFDVPKPTNVC